MARVPSKHDRDQNLDFQGFLNNLQDWELSFKEKEKKLKAVAQEEKKVDLPTPRGKVNNASQLSNGPGLGGIQGQLKEHGSGSSQVFSSRKTGIVGGDKRPRGRTLPDDYSRSKAGQFDYSRNYNAINRISSSFLTEESTPDAASEKELGNEYFKQKKFNEAIECYSRSIALSPTAVASANRAMAYLKIKRQILYAVLYIFEEAENDCTEALNLDDRYIKAYSRRATARKELGKLKESIEDSEFALRLEPHNQEVKKQYTEAKSLYQKEILEKASGALGNSIQGMQKVGKSIVEVKGNVHGTGVTAVQVDRSEENDGKVLGKASVAVKEIESTTRRTRNRTGGQELDGSQEGATPSSNAEGSKTNHFVDNKRELKASVQELASRAASRAMAEAAKNITPPKSAYQFEVSWRGLSGDRTLQARLLKAISPNALPQLFKNSLSAPILIDIVKCIATFFMEEVELVVNFLDNLTKVSRFDMIIMCLSSADRTDLLKIWKEVFLNEAVPANFAETLGKLHSKYCLIGWQMDVLEESNVLIKEMS
ncbi:hypothetical protein HHK36_020887 [Tetracentron sinense]|uniref:RNA-polymerase II-associated protein 3-like C-terminal domain-containing protein n=1 Tax=Tetracentron sinense TaxID=13715 RepID=A0A834YZQ6_TETSI|nr:hypothetical protein HHK36_020887 [Tetracentron sinense]